MFSISCTFSCVVEQYEWVFCGAYELNSNQDRKLLCEDLAGIYCWGLPK